MAVEVDEGGALVLWCLMLPELRRAAAAGGWADRLERTATRVREGGSALDACRRFDLIPDGLGEDGIGDGGIGDGGIGDGGVRGIEPTGPANAYPDPRGPRSPAVGRGSYRCPRGRCGRRDHRDDEGRPPVCALFDDEPMLPGGSPR
ncbi:hypothetical protein ACIGNX_02190 [Actinosynnema sp. NPDC053489]|uniref:hypothetical protein n=1 Tax=Actinosynnema sp. NPDC053489 TaxID=3363916 RepID=UPI0037C74581